MQSLAQKGKVLYQIYVGIGIAAMAFVSGSVIFTVIMRYCFNVSFTFLEELITLVFAFTTFWGIGICVLEDEHVVIDFFYEKIPVAIRQWISVFNYLVVLVVLAVLQYYSIGWIQVAGKIISNGLRVKYLYLYGVMPIGVGVSMVCVLVKIISLVLNKPLNLRPCEEPPKEEAQTW